MNAASDLTALFARTHTLAMQRNLRRINLLQSDGRPALSVDGQIFVQQHDQECLFLHCPSEQKALLLEISPEIYFETEELVGQPAVLVRLANISDEELSLRLADAWQFIAEDSA